MLNNLKTVALVLAAALTASCLSQATDAATVFKVSGPKTQFAWTGPLDAVAVDQAGSILFAPLTSNIPGVANLYYGQGQSGSALGFLTSDIGYAVFKDTGVAFFSGKGDSFYNRPLSAVFHPGSYTVEGPGGDYSLTINTIGVPEPVSWALMLIGVGGVGAALRASRRTAAPAV